MTALSRTAESAAAHRVMLAVAILSRLDAVSRGTVQIGRAALGRAQGDSARKDWNRTLELLRSLGIELEEVETGVVRVARWRPAPPTLEPDEVDVVSQALADLPGVEDAMAHAHLRRALRKLLLAGVPIRGATALLGVPLRATWSRRDVLTYASKEAVCRGQLVSAVVQESEKHDAAIRIVLEITDIDRARGVVTGITPDGKVVELDLSVVREFQRIQRGAAPASSTGASVAARAPPLIATRELLSCVFFAFSFMQAAHPAGLTATELRLLSGVRRPEHVDWTLQALRDALKSVDDPLLTSVEVLRRGGRVSVEPLPTPLDATRPLTKFEAGTLVRHVRRAGPRSSPGAASRAEEKLLANVRPAVRAFARRFAALAIS